MVRSEPPTRERVTFGAPITVGLALVVLGERLGLKQDDDFDRLEEQVSGLEDDDPAVYALAVYDFLTWLQETLAHALTP